MRVHPSLLNQRIFVTGITGIHGWPIYCRLASFMPPERLFGIGPPGMKKPSGGSLTACCITDRKCLREIRNFFKPTLLIHCAGVCDLDVCEMRPQWAEKINREGTAAVVEIFGDLIPVVYLSTDLVFSGNDPPAGGYTEKHAPDPVSVAGKTFLLGEKELTGCREWTIIRLGLPMGPSVTGDKGGLDWIENRFRKSRPVTLFTDEYRSVIACSELARCVGEFVAVRRNGLFHLGGPISVSLHELGQMIISGGGYNGDLLKSLRRHEEVDGPPRIGNVALNSGKIVPYLSSVPGTWRYEGTPNTTGMKPGSPIRP